MRRLVESSPVRRAKQALDRPIRRGELIAAWAVSTGFVALLTQREGLAARGDDWQFMTPATLLAHGYASCAFVWHGHYAPTGPVLPIVLAAMLVITRYGMAGHFRVTAHFSTACHNAGTLAASWWTQNHRETWLLVLSSLAWIALVAGVTALVRTSERGRTGWEVLACLALAVTPPVFMTMTSPAHPEYPLALGLALLGWACLRRGRDVGAGALLALAVVSQESALLVAIPLLVWGGRATWRAAVSFVITAGAVAGTLDALTKGRLTSVFTGAGIPGSAGDTWIGETHLHHLALRAVSRGAPLILSVVLAWLSRHRVGDPRRGNIAAALWAVAASCDLRLLFDVSVWGYYFSATALMVVAAMVVEARWRVAAVVWLVALSVVFNPLPHLYWHEGIAHVPEWLVHAAFTSSAFAICLVALARPRLHASDGLGSSLAAANP